jgi:hypothetical protein
MSYLIAYFLGLVTLPIVFILLCSLVAVTMTDDEIIRMSEMRR